MTGYRGRVGVYELLEVSAPIAEAIRRSDLGELERLAARQPTAVISSPLLRARETAGLIARACGLEAATDERLAPGATADTLREAAAAVGGTVVAVAHQPDCSEIVLELTGREVSFRPAGVAELEL
jgi:phosphohistidine phosphatase SixA